MTPLGGFDSCLLVLRMYVLFGTLVNRRLRSVCSCRPPSRLAVE
jgi:hypothetical protein